MSMHKTIVLGTNNPHKKEKLRWIVEGYFSVIREMRDKIDIEETGKTFEENARIKAQAIARREQALVIATDGGVLIPSIGKDWNELLTKRFVGRGEVNDFERMDALLEMMKEKKGDERTITWKESIALASPERVLFSVEVEGDTGVLQERYNPQQYKEGIWVCTLWSYPQFGGRNFFELNEEEKKHGEISWWKLRAKTREFLSSFSPRP